MTPNPKALKDSIEFLNRQAVKEHMTVLTENAVKIIIAEVRRLQSRLEKAEKVIETARNQVRLMFGPPADIEHQQATTQALIDSVHSYDSEEPKNDCAST